MLERFDLPGAARLLWAVRLSAFTWETRLYDDCGVVALALLRPGVVMRRRSALFAQSKDDKKKDDAQKKEIQNIVKIVDDVAAGQPAPNDLSLTWVREDVLKAQGNKEYVPFTVTIDPSKVTGGNVAFYWRVVVEGRGRGRRRRRADAKDDKKDKTRTRTRSPTTPTKTSASCR